MRLREQVKRCEGEWLAETRQKARAGDAACMLLLAEMLVNGYGSRGVPQLREARDWLQAYLAPQRADNDDPQQQQQQRPRRQQEEQQAVGVGSGRAVTATEDVQRAECMLRRVREALRQGDDCRRERKRT